MGPWRVRWHVAADGTVIQERSRGDEAHQQLFQTFSTTRPVTVAELDALSESWEQEITGLDRFSVLWWTGMAVFFGAFVALGGLLTHLVGDEIVPGLVVGAVAGLLLMSPAFRLVAMLLPEDVGGSAERLWREAGLVSSSGTTMKAVEARALIRAPGSTSGVARPVGRA